MIENKDLTLFTSSDQGYASMLGPTQSKCTSMLLPTHRTRISTLDDLQAECDAMRGYDADWYEKMMHRIPMVASVNRVQYILDHCVGKRVLHLGCNWPVGYLHKSIAVVAHKLYGVDISVPDGLDDDSLCVHANLDSYIEVHGLTESLKDQNIELILCAEILEHLGNPGNLLNRLKDLQCSILITVPNAFSRAGYYHATSGAVEAVNPEHVAYYSYHTLKVLVERYGYSIQDFKWYNGQPGTAEGLIMVVA